MAPSQIVESQIQSDKMSPTQENKPPIPVGAGPKKAMETFFAGPNHLEFRQRSSSASRSTRTFSRGSTPSRDAANVKTGASGCPEGAVDPEILKNALKKIPSVEKIAIRPTPPRSRSISRSNSPLPEEELLDESLPDFYKVTLKTTERTGSQTRDILLGGNRLSRGATPTGDASVPEFRRVALRRTPSREQLTDEQAHKRSTLKKNAVVEASSTANSTTNLSRSASFTSLTAINKTVLSRRNSIASEEKQQPEFKGVVLKKTGSKPGSRAGSPSRLDSGSRGELSASAASLLKKVEKSSSTSSRRGSATSETAAEFANVSLKKTKRVQGDQSKFEVEQVSLRPIPVGEGEETTVSSSSMGMRREERASSVTRQRVLRETKFEANDEEYHDIKSSLDRLKKKEASPAKALSVEDDAAAGVRKAPKKPAHVEEDAAAKPLAFRRPKRLTLEEEEAEKVQLKPVDRQKSSKDNTPAIDDDEDDAVARSLALRRSKRMVQEKEQVEKAELKQVHQENSSKEESTKIDEAATLSLAEKRQEKLSQQKDAAMNQQESIKAKKSSKDTSPAEDDAAAKPVALRRPKKLPKEEEAEAEKVQLKPISREKKTFTSSIECVKKATEEEEERQEMKKMERPVLLRKTSYTSSLDNIAIGGEDQKQVHLICFSKENSGSAADVAENKPPLLRKMSFTSSLDNIAIGSEEREKVHLSCFSKQMGSNVDLVQVCQEQEEGKHEVKLEFKIEEKDAMESEKQVEKKETDEQLEEDLTERIVERRLSWMAKAEVEQPTAEAVKESTEEVIEERLCATETAVEGGAGISRLQAEENQAEEEDSEEEMEEEVVEEVTTTLQKIRKAPSIDGLFQRQDVQAAFTFTLPFQNEQPTTKLSLEIPSLS